VKNLWVVLLLWLLALGFALNTGRDLAYQVFYTITGVMVITLLWSWANLRGLRLNRVDHARRLQVGKYLEESLELTNGSWLPKLWVEVKDFSTLPDHRAGRVINSLRGHGSARWQLRTMCRLRGRYRLGPTLLSSGDPLGLFHFERYLPSAVSFLVVPAAVDISEFAPPAGYLAGGQTNYRRTPWVTTSVSGVRDYVQGDSLNRIHWPSTARTGRLIAKEFELDPLSDVWVFLDMYDGSQAATMVAEQLADDPLPWLHAQPTRIGLPPSTVEYGVAVAASLAQHFVRQGRSVGFLSYAGKRIVVHPDRGERQLDRLLEVLAVLQAEGRVPIGQVLNTEGLRLNRHTMLVAITPSTDPEWVRALRGLRVRGIHGVGVMMAARTFGPAAPWEPALAELQTSGVPGYLVKYSDDLSAALSQPVA
jgi:uncharacterized protein (DUF58 family)